MPNLYRLTENSTQLLKTTQAKGRVDGISDLDAGNNFLPGFVDRFNERFAVLAAKPENLHRQMNVAPSRLNDILCRREQRYVGAQLSFHYDRKQIILERSAVSENLAGQYVELYNFADRPLEVKWKRAATSLPCLQ